MVPPRAVTLKRRRPGRCELCRKIRTRRSRSSSSCISRSELSADRASFANTRSPSVPSADLPASDAWPTFPSQNPTPLRSHKIVSFPRSRAEVRGPDCQGPVFRMGMKCPKCGIIRRRVGVATGGYRPEANGRGGCRAAGGAPGRSRGPPPDSLSPSLSNSAASRWSAKKSGSSPTRKLTTSLLSGRRLLVFPQRRGAAGFTARRSGTLAAAAVGNVPWETEPWGRIDHSQ